MLLVQGSFRARLPAAALVTGQHFDPHTLQRMIAFNVALLEATMTKSD